MHTHVRKGALIGHKSNSCSVAQDPRELSNPVIKEVQEGGPVSKSPLPFPTVPHGRILKRDGNEKKDFLRHNISSFYPGINGIMYSDLFRDPDFSLRI